VLQGKHAPFEAEARLIISSVMSERITVSLTTQIFAYLESGYT